MPRALHLSARLAGLVLAACLSPGAALAEPVTLTARSDGFSVTGDLVAFDGRFYRVDAPEGVLTLSAAQVDCTGAACPAANETTGFAVTSAFGPGAVVLPALIQAYARARDLPLRREDLDATHIRFALGDDTTPRRFPISLRLALSGEGFADLAVGEADMVLADRLISEAELSVARDAGLGDLSAPGQERVLAWDALVAVTSPRRPRQPVDPAQVLALWDMSAPDWRALGFAEGPLRLHARAHGGDLVKLRPDGALPAAPVTYHEQGAGLAAVVREQPSGLGLVALSERGPAQALPLAGACGLTHAPTRAALTLGRYPWAMPLTAYLPERRMPLDLADFLAFLDSEAAGRVVDRAGFAQPSLAPVASDLAARVLRALAGASDADLPRLQEVARRLGQATQLGLTFRPDAADRGGRALSAAALEMLAEAEDGRFLLAAHAPTRAQAEADAGQLLVELAALRGGRAPLEIEVAALGPALPVACADAPWAASMNRRIDVWRLPATGSPPRGN